MRIGDKFNELKRKNEGALIAYICAGDPTPDDTKRYVVSLIKGGADIIELGLPFSDPTADGPTIQAGIERALNGGMTPDVYFKTVGALRVNTPLVVMTYYNLIFKRGLETFVKDCASSGISGIIVPDLPAEESEELALLCSEYDIDLIFLVAPTTTGARMDRILSRGTGFIYLVARLGVTGARSDIASSTQELIKRVKTATPKAVGFGISNGKQAAEIIHAGADGVIVGSAFVDIIASGKDTEQRLEALARELKDGIRAVKEK
ncbi:tryptophan synthase, alpha chain [Candidatus Methanoperedens nitroreducens]|uniref:Tryptophan synthase alpha chain n=1 Tax=Candidatus Methanoperedens nitratireducens TaxID=1392998 RepID=A0A062UVY4_9EURY|nr:tryptophan synthase subunit alpha [Candidatus Methanoperedens nitroreducens]KCZ71186.1 tryptophan synthase, alpha chain [Candidatus Methanoperedens nitroreducens]MDJ1421436.1 tryptophan synthase subunit alpha [Candidatus Methanoperedens sp.]